MDDDRHLSITVEAGDLIDAIAAFLIAGGHAIGVRFMEHYDVVARLVAATDRSWTVRLIDRETREPFAPVGPLVVIQAASIAHVEVYAP